ncbi:MAG: tetratricopeptide repeat protein [Planctomycetota bacterium]
MNRSIFYTLCRRWRLGITVLLLALALGAAALGRVHMLDRRATAAREAGLAAFAAQDYETALDQIGRYLQRFPNTTDSEAWHAYGRAREEQPVPDHSHISDAIRAFRNALTSDPGHTPSAHALLERYTQLGWSSDAKPLAEAWLVRQPNDAIALRALATAQYRLRDSETCLKSLVHLLEIEPLDLHARYLHSRLLIDDGQNADQISDQLSETLPEPDQRDHLVFFIAQAQVLSGEAQAARDTLDQLIAQPTIDPRLAGVLVAQLDSFGDFTASARAVAATMRHPAGPEPGFDHEWLLIRWWELNRPDRVVEVAHRLEDQSLLSPAARACLTISHWRKGNGPAADKLATTLDPAMAWGHLVHVSLEGGGEVPRLSEQQSDEDGFSDDPHVVAWNALATAEAGQFDRAVNDLTAVVNERPAWFDARLWLVQALYAADRVPEAAAEVDELLRLFGNQPDAAAWWCTVMTDVAISGTPIQAKQHNAQLAHYRDLLPDDPRVALAHARAQAHIGNLDGSDATIQELVRLIPAIGPDLVAEAIEFARAYSLPSADLLSRTATARFPDHTQITRMTAYAIPHINPSEYSAESTDAALVALMDLKRIKDIDVRLSAWRTLLAERSEDRRVLLTAGRDHQLLRDPDLRNILFARVERHFAPDDASALAIRTRGLLASNASPREVAAAADRLLDTLTRNPRDSELRLLLAHCLVALDQPPAALRQLLTVLNQQPYHTTARLRAARLLMGMGREPDALRHLEQAVRQPGVRLSRLQSDSAAELAIRLQRPDLGLEALVAGEDAISYSPQGLIQAISLALAAGRPEYAQGLLNQTSPDDHATIAQLASTYARYGEAATARELLARIPTQTSDPSTGIALGSAYLALGMPEISIDQLERVTEAKNVPSEVWPLLMMANVAAERLESTLSVAHRAAQAQPRSGWPAVFRVFQDVAPQGTNSLAWRMASALILCPDEAPVVAEFLSDHPASLFTSSHNAAEALTGAAFIHPRHDVLRLAAADARFAAGEPDLAADFVLEHSPSFERSAWGLQLLCLTHASRRDWNAAAQTANNWRRLSPTQAAQADVLLAQVRLQQQRGTAALSILEPYLDSARSNAAAYGPALAAYASALIQMDRADEAHNLLSPLLPGSARWRLTWAHLAATRVSKAHNAKAWLDYLEQLTETTAYEERLALANAWRLVAEQTTDDEALDRAISTLAAIDLVRVTVTPEYYNLVGILHELRGQTELAEIAYREGLDTFPESAMTLNNLAFLLLANEKSVDEAYQLARHAVELDPHDPDKLHTLGLAMSLRGDFAAAEELGRQAMSLDPRNPEWSLWIAEQAVRANEPQVAREYLSHAELLLVSSTPHTAELQPRVDTLYTALSEVVPLDQVP